MKSKNLTTWDLDVVMAAAASNDVVAMVDTLEKMLQKLVADAQRVGLGVGDIQRHPIIVLLSTSILNEAVGMDWDEYCIRAKEKALSECILLRKQLFQYTKGKPK